MMLSTQSTDQSASSGVRQSTPLAATGSFLTKREKTMSMPVRKVSSDSTRDIIRRTEKTVSQRVKK
jgi:uncharacterized protein YaaQ